MHHTCFTQMSYTDNAPGAPTRKHGLCARHAQQHATQHVPPTPPVPLEKPPRVRGQRRGEDCRVVHRGIVDADAGDGDQPQQEHRGEEDAHARGAEALQREQGHEDSDGDADDRACVSRGDALKQGDAVGWTVS